MPPDLLGQPRLGDRHAVLHEHLRLVEVGAELEGDGERQPAVVGGLAAHVEHVLDAVDLLLDRRGDGVGDRLRRRPRIAWSPTTVGGTPPDTARPASCSDAADNQQHDTNRNARTGAGWKDDRDRVEPAPLATCGVTLAPTRCPLQTIDDDAIVRFNPFAHDPQVVIRLDRASPGASRPRRPCRRRRPLSATGHW